MDDRTKTLETLETLEQLVRERKIDRRKLMQAAGAMGLTTAAAAGVATKWTPSAAAQAAAGTLVTVSTQ